MIESATFVNFQTHEELTIKFDPCVTTIVGETDAGKSAILRGLYWMFFNQPSGLTDILRTGSDQVKVILRLDGKTVIRSKGTKSNSYRLDKQLYKAFGTGGVPEPIQNLFNVDETNFQDQHDPPFWFKLTPGQVSKNLNQIVNLDVMDTTIKNIASKLRSERSILEVTQSRYKQAREARKKLSWVADADKLLRNIESKRGVLEQLTSRAAEVVVTLDKVRTYQKSICLAEESRRKGQELVFLTDKSLKLQQQRLNLQKLLDDIKNAKEVLKIKLPDLTPIQSRLPKLFEKITILSGTLHQIKQREDELCQLKKERRTLESTLETVEMCPMCGSPLKK